MKISAPQEQLSHALKVAGRAVATRSPLPITTNVLLTIDDGRLRVSATNLDIAISTWIEAAVAEAGAITLPAKLLAEFVDTLPSAPVDLSVKDGSHSAHVAAGRYQANIRGMNADDFPAIPTASEQAAASIHPKMLKDMIEQVAFAAAVDDTRPTLTGAQATFSNDQLTLCATDGFRLAVRTGHLEGNAVGDFSANIPARTLLELARILPDDDEAVEIAVTPNRNQVVFRTSNLQVVSRLIEGTFPAYRQIIPTRFSTRVVINTGDLLKATKIASFFSRDNSNIISLEISPGGDAGVGAVVVTGSAAELGDDRAELDAVVSGDPMKVLLNSRYVSDLLGAVQSTQVGMELTGPHSACVFKPIDDVEYQHLIMPMHGGR